MNLGKEAREISGDKGENMKATGNRTAWFRKAVASVFAAMLLGLLLVPVGANAAKVDNPSPPNFRIEITGGFLQFIGTSGTPLQLPLDFASFDPPLPNPSLVGTITTNPAGYGVINVPAANVTFPPIPVDVDGISLTVRLLPVGDATGFIDPLGGRVNLNLPIRLKAEGSALGQSLGNNCYVGSAANPIAINTTTNEGTFPTTNPTPVQPVYVADFVSDGGSFAGGWLAAEPYSDEAGSWPLEPKPVPGKPVGSLPKPTPAEIPYNALTDYIPREAGTWRAVNETLAAPLASGCGTGLAAGVVNDQVNTLIGLPSASGASTASFDFRFAATVDRPGANAIVNKAVKSKFTAPGVSASPWLGTQTPTAVSSQPLSIDASTSYFKVGGNATERYRFDLGTGSFGAWSTNPVANFSAPFIASGGDPILLPIRVQVKDSASDVDTSLRYLRVVPATDILLDTEITSVAGNGNLRGGSEGHVKFTVTNDSDTDDSSQSIAFNATLPSGVTLTSLDSPGSWTCSSDASSISCSLPQGGLPPKGESQFDATVAVDAGATNPAKIQASAVMVGDPAPANNQVNLNVPVRKTDLTVSVGRTQDLVANGWFPYTVNVSNVGDGVTVGGSSVQVSLPSDFTYRSQGSGGTGWSCTPANPQDITCSRTDEIAGNGSAPVLTIWARVDRNTPAEARAVSATVSTQADINAFGGNNTGSNTGTVQILPDLAVDVSVTGDYKVGDPGTITYSATNESVLTANGPTTISSTLPAGLTVTAVSGPGWDCSATVPGSSEIDCEYAANINAGDTTGTVTATVAVAQAAYPGVTIPVELANANDGFVLNDTDSADVQVRRLDVQIQKLAVRPFNVGIEGRYRLNVTNVGDANTVGPITVTDQLPAGLKVRGVSGAGWDCSGSAIGGQNVICILTNTLGAGIQAAPIEIRVDVLDEAAEAGTVINTGYVDTLRDNRSVPADEAITANNTSTIGTTAVAVDLSIESRHQGDFRVETEDVYSLDIRNVGFFGTDPGEPITVTDDLPEGIIPIVDEIDATRPVRVWVEDEGDVTFTLEAPDENTSAMAAETSVTIDIPVQVTDAAADVSDNVAEVSTARDSNPTLSPNNVAVDPTNVKRIDLEVTGSVSIAPRAGGIGEVTVNVSNVGSTATWNPTTVVVPLATGNSYRPTGSTITGWSCASPGAGTQITCVRNPSIASGAAAPVLKLRTNVATSAPDSWTTDVTASTDGEAATKLVNNELALEQTLEKIDLAITKSFDPAAIQSGKRGSFKIHVENVGNRATVATYRIDENVNSTLQNVAASGAGWTCAVTGNQVGCTRTATLAAGASAPDITVSFDVPGDAAGTRSSTATVSSTDDPYPSNNSATSVFQIVASADITVGITQPSIVRVGDQVDVSYRVRNIGTDSTSGSPSVKLNIGTSAGLNPIGGSSNGAWDCEAIPAAGSDPAYLSCELGQELGVGDDTILTGEFEVVPSGDSQVLTLATVQTAGEINKTNNFATATSDIRGIDLQSSVSVPVSATEHMVAGTTTTRQVTVENVGTTTTTGPVTVTGILPAGVQWDSGVAAGTGWTCALQGSNVRCQRGDQIGTGQSAPVLNLGLRASRQNAPEVQVSYVVSTQNDENAANDSASRTEEVRFFPQTEITSAPSGTTQSRSASVVFTSDEPNATYECKVDSGTFAACTSPLNLSNLSIGEHNVQVRAINGFAMVDDTPASVTWSVEATPLEGPNHPFTADSTGGSLSLASLGTVDLPANQVKLDGLLYTDNGGISVPASGVNFATVVQSIPDVLGPGSSVDVEISISATADGQGILPNGGGAASFVLPVRADVQAKLSGTSLFPEGTECSLRPITFDLAGTYDETAGTVHLEQPNVAFPLLTGCPGFKATIESLLGLPRNDIELELDFNITKSCEAGQVGTPPDCVPAETPAPNLAKPVVKAPKKVKAGKKITLSSTIRNTGEGDASNVKVCLTSPTKLIKGSAKRCRTVTTIAAGKSTVVKFTVNSKKSAKGKKANFTVQAAYMASGEMKYTKTGHVTILK